MCVLCFVFFLLDVRNGSVGPNRWVLQSPANLQNLIVFSLYFLMALLYCFFFSQAGTKETVQLESILKVSN